MATYHRGGAGNFANDPKRAAEAGRKGGQRSHSNQHSQAGDDSKRQQGGGTFADDAKRASKAGKKGGQR